MQGFAFNLRRDQFKDARLRRAFNYAFDFEEMNKQLFYGQYKRINSYFDGTELASSGLPEGQELEILETVRDKVPAEVFTTPYTNPVGGNPEAVRDNLRESARLLKEAGFEVRDRKLVDAAGKPVTVEILVAGSVGRAHRAVLQAVAGTHRRHRHRSASSTTRSTRTGCAASISTSSSIVWGKSLSPGNEQREFWGSQAADQPGSQNTIGIKNPAVDALIDKVIFAKDRADLVAATKALDRVLLWNFYVVPQFTYRLLALRALGPLQPCRAAAEIRPFRPAVAVVVRRRQGRQDRQAILRDFRAWRCSPAGMCSVSASAR